MAAPRSCTHRPGSNSCLFLICNRVAFGRCASGARNSTSLCRRRTSGYRETRCGPRSSQHSGPLASLKQVRSWAECTRRRTTVSARCLISSHPNHRRHHAGLAHLRGGFPTTPLAKSLTLLPPPSYLATALHTMDGAVPKPEADPTAGGRPGRLHTLGNSSTWKDQAMSPVGSPNRAVSAKRKHMIGKR